MRLHDGDYRAPDKITLSDYMLKRWLPTKRATRRGPPTRNTATGATVAQQPGPAPKLSHTYRSQHVKHNPGRHRIFVRTLAKIRVIHS